MQIDNPTSVRSTGQGDQNPSTAAPSSPYLYRQHSSYAPYPTSANYSQHGTPGYAEVTALARQVYSYVPIPGVLQPKRRRRAHNEIERMYMCGWNGCEKAYGTLNHLNAHVTMQSHGQKRTPEEFKEIRKEWKQRKKEEEARRKAEDDLKRAAPASVAQNGGEYPLGPNSLHFSSCPRRVVELPPGGYQPTQYSAPPSGSVSQQPMPEYGAGYMHPNNQPYNTDV